MRAQNLFISNYIYLLDTQINTIYTLGLGSTWNDRNKIHSFEFEIIICIVYVI